MKQCFVIMPIGSGKAYETYRNRYETIVKPAIEEFTRDGTRVFDSIRGDFITTTGSITKSVIQQIFSADLVVADLTDLNPNVFYELGVRHALRNGTILVALEGTELPFNIGDLKVIYYEDRVGGEKKAIPIIMEMISNFINDPRPDDSPVFAVLPQLHIPGTRDLHEIQAKLSASTAEIEKLRGQLVVAQEINLSFRESFSVFERTMNSVLDKLTPQHRKYAMEAVENAAQARLSESQQRIGAPPGVDESDDVVLALIPYNPEMEPLYDVIEDASRGLGLRPTRADKVTTSRTIAENVLDAISRATLVIVDITGRNPNVLAEFGMSQAMGKRVIVISRDRENIPFDVARRRVIFYEMTISGMFRLREHLVTAIQQHLVDREKSRQPHGEILSPQHGQRVRSVFTAEGRLAGIAPGKHAWLAVRIGNLMWPKKEICSTGQQWTLEVVEAGSPQEFSLVLLMTGSTGNEEIKEWLREGERKRDFPGLQNISDSVPLTEVTGLSLE